MRDLLIRAALLIAALAGTSQAVLGGCPPGMRHVGFGICIQQCNGNAVCLGPGAMSDSPAVDRPEPSLCPPGVRQVRCARDPCEVVRCPAHPDAQCLANYCGGCNAVFYDNDGNRVDCDQVPPLCPPGVPVFNCFANPCDVASCPANLDATCQANYCGGCNAEFFDEGGNEVNCGEFVTTTQPPTRPPGCEYQGQFYPPGSTIHETHGCMGHGVRCEEGGQILIWDNFRYGCCEHNGQYYEEGATITEGGVTCHCELSHTGEPASMICPSPPTCPPDVEVVNCFANPCDVTSCPAHPDATCRSNYCGGCYAEFFDEEGNEVDCDETDHSPCPPGVAMARCKRDPCEMRTCPGHPNATCQANYCGGCNAEFFDEDGNEVACGEAAVVERPDICPTPTLRDDQCLLGVFKNCSIDTDCRRREKCCFNGCQKTCVHVRRRRPLPERPGTCPAPSLSDADCSGPRLYRVCTTDLDCRRGEKCCDLGCGQECVGVRGRETSPDGPFPERPGTCPAPSLSDADCSGPRLYRVCTTDLDCRRGEKCCDLGCGHECVAVRGRETSPDRPKPGTCPPPLSNDECLLPRPYITCTMEGGGCQRGYVCCDNGCGGALECKRPVRGPMKSKPGTCPASEREAPCRKGEWSQCQGDPDCPQRQKCCSDGCVMICQNPDTTNEPVTKCQDQLQNTQPMPGQFVKQCEEDGSFSTQQCHGSAGFCYCAHPQDGTIYRETGRRGEMKHDCETFWQTKVCSENSHFDTCGHGDCQPTCENPTPICTQVCIAGCQCDDGFALHDGTCIPMSQCERGEDDLACGENSHFDTCGHGDCQPTCENPAPICTQVCIAGCQCDDGFALHDGTCIPMSQCERGEDDSVCGENSHFDTCGHGDCQPTCENPAPICTQVCIAGCQCDDGFALHDGTCIPMSQCESGEDDSVCGENSHFDTCGHGDCQPTCENPAPICTQVCIAGCQCDDGFALHGGTCIPMSQCESGEDDFVFPERPGTCPALSLSDADCSGPRLYRVCTTDLDCRTAEKCCDLGCGQECVEVRRREPSPDRPFRERPGTCPAPSLSDADCSGPRLYRVCTMDIDCHRREKCCNNACGVKECIRLNRSRRPMRHKPGTCPAPSPLLSRDCTRGRRNQCEGDLECPLRQKCCMDGCVKVCQNPIPRIVPGRRPPVSSGRTDAETTTEPDSNGVAVAFRQHDIVPDVIDTAPTVAAEVTYGVADDGVISVDFGNELTPTQVKSPPQVTWPVDDGSLYTLVMTDPDAPSRANPRFREFHHWLVGNIPGNDIQNGETLSQYIGSAPPRRRGLHRYVFLVYEQPGRLEFEERRLGNSSMAHRSRFRTREFASKYNLGDPVAGNFYQAQWDDWVPSLYAAMRQ
ncbi:PEBP1 [Branchiostoma lanceolatum]|uniref:PEBP1 protein n=1 Tax=Branchiostoma lanceolatum TaxID=7740 RepID=A0A8K0A6K8_BRALA|nr:PEBP1 [Branchiostoma lanceolatum]